MKRTTKVAVSEMMLELATSFWDRLRSFLIVMLSCRKVSLTLE